MDVKTLLIGAIAGYCAYAYFSNQSSSKSGYTEKVYTYPCVNTTYVPNTTYYTTRYVTPSPTVYYVKPTPPVTPVYYNTYPSRPFIPPVFPYGHPHHRPHEYNWHHGCFPRHHGRHW